jgi:putative endonuclease
VDRRALGTIGEEAALRHLRARGYRIRARNVRCPLGELDVVAEQGGELVFVEVKTRSTTDRGAPFDAITPAKRRRLWRLATYYLVTHRLQDRPCRFDAVSVLVTPRGQVVRVEVRAGAFDGGP